MKNFGIIIVVTGLLLSLTSSKKPNEKKDIDTLKLNWSAEIGNLSYRSKIVLADNSLFIGSNGSHFNDLSVLDETNGVYKINPRNGTILKRIANELFGDMDVNGIVEFENTIIFGNDNDELLCFDLNGNKKWRIPTSGDIEHVPTLIKNGEQNILVYATENGEISGVNPENGNTLWHYYHKKFDGWKAGNNRNIFKIKSHFMSNQLFFDKPIVIDVNNDGVKDIIYSNYEDITCINPINGAKIWYKKIEVNENEYAIRRSPLNLSVSKNKIQFHYIIRNYKFNKIRLITLNNYGNKIDEKQIQMEDLSNNHFTNYLIDKNGIYDLLNDQFHPLEISKSYTYACSEKLFMYNNEPCIVIVSDGYFDHEKRIKYVSNVKIIGLKTFKIHLSKGLQENTEAVPQIADINKDGKLDLLIGCYDQKIYCYDLGIPSSNLINN